MQLTQDHWDDLNSTQNYGFVVRVYVTFLLRCTKLLWIIVIQDCIHNYSHHGYTLRCSLWPTLLNRLSTPSHLAAAMLQQPVLNLLPPSFQHPHYYPRNQWPHPHNQFLRHTYS